MVGRDAEADEAPGRRQPVDQVDLDLRILALQQRVRGVEPGRAGADDGDTKRRRSCDARRPDITSSARGREPEPSALRGRSRSRLLRRLGDLEAVPAAAGARDVRVLDLEPGLLEALDEVDRRALQVRRAERVDDDLDAVELELVVAGLARRGRTRARTRSRCSRRPGSRSGAPRPRRPAPAAIRPLTFVAARSVSVTTVVSDCSIVAMRPQCTRRARSRELRDTCNADGYTPRGVVRAASVRRRTTSFSGGSRLVQRLVAVRDLRALRPDDPGNDDDRELRVRDAAASPRARAHDPVRVRRLEGPPKRQRFTVSFYLTAMLFILFDIEIVFLYPLAVILHELSWFGFFEFLDVPRHPARRLRLHLAEGSARMALDKPLRESGLQVRAPALADQGPVEVRGRGRGPRAEGRADHAREGRRLGADEVDVARHLRARVLRDRDDVDRLEPLRHRALRDGGVPLLAAPGRPADRLRPRVAQDGRAAAPDLRPDARAEVGDRDGRLRVARAGCSTTTRSSSRSTRSSPVDIYVPGCPPRPEQLMEGIVRLHEAVQAGVPPAYELRSVAS